MIYNVPTITLDALFYLHAEFRRLITFFFPLVISLNIFESIIIRSLWPGVSQWFIIIIGHVNVGPRPFYAIFTTRVYGDIGAAERHSRKFKPLYNGRVARHPDIVHARLTFKHFYGLTILYITYL